MYIFQCKILQIGCKAVHISLILAVVGVLLTALGIYLGWFLFPTIISNKVKENVILIDGSEQYERFVNLPQPLTFKVYIFNVTNQHQIQNGAIPVVQEVGPYVYKQYRTKKVKHFSQDGSKITFVQDQLFVFDAEASAPLKESDEVVVLNMHMNAFLQTFEREITDILQSLANRINYRLNHTPGVRILKRLMDRIRGKRKSLLQIDEHDPSLALLLMHINANIKSIFNDPQSMFISTTVKKYLFDGVRFCIRPFGIARVICNQIKDSGAKTIRNLNDGSLAFSFLSHKNGTGQEVFEVHTGKGNVMKVMEIQKLDDSNNLQVWLNNTNSFGDFSRRRGRGSSSSSDDISSSSDIQDHSGNVGVADGGNIHNRNEISMCNYINGTDASMFPPFRQKGDSMYIFSTDICRSVQLFYQHEINYKGIPGYRYSIGENFINDIGPEHGNDCFCIDKLTNVIKRKNGCLYTGALDLTTCLGAPVILTLPHMLGASNEYRRTVRGLHPNAEKHQTYVDVQHLTGIPLRGGKRVQFNMFLKNINRIKITEHLSTVLMPVIWLEEGIELNDQMVSYMKVKLIYVLLILKVVHWSLVILGIMVTVICVIYCLLKQRKSTIKPTT